MSASATAAGYLYASGQLRGRGAREQERGNRPPPPNRQARKEIRISVLPAPAKRTPKIEYRRRKRWIVD